jgi:hypothetical protein
MSSHTQTHCLEPLDRVGAHERAHTQERSVALGALKPEPTAFEAV